jgi:hypothetical protein
LQFHQSRKAFEGVRAGATERRWFFALVADGTDSGALFEVETTPHAVQIVVVEREVETLPTHRATFTDGFGTLGIVTEHDRAFVVAVPSRHPIFA